MLVDDTGADLPIGGCEHLFPCNLPWGYDRPRRQAVRRQPAQAPPVAVSEPWRRPCRACWPMAGVPHPAGRYTASYARATYSDPLEIGAAGGQGRGL